jgi:starch phosphorylase
MSLIAESTPQQLRMSHLAMVGSHAINGVSELHTQLIKASVARDFFELWPQRFSNKTNGITPRRWLLQANPRLAELITATIGDGWITELGRLRALEQWATDPGFQDEFRRIKRANKQRLARLIEDTAGTKTNPDALFDIQTKRIHAYKRQVLHLLHVIHEYLSLIEDGQKPLVARAHVFAGKAAPGYWMAKQVIRLIHDVGRVINNDARAGEWLQVAFVPDFRVSLAEKIIPAADLSEQISTPGTEASGTGNMKFALNGALTIGTLDGANIEIMNEVGRENIFIFGLDVGALQAMRQRGAYRPRDHYDRDPRVRRIVDALGSGRFCPHEPGLCAGIRDQLLDARDEYFHLADLSAYLDMQRTVGEAFHNPREWARRAILNVARIGKFSSDRAVAEYARDIWAIESGTAGAG